MIFIPHRMWHFSSSLNFPYSNRDWSLRMDLQVARILIQLWGKETSLVPHLHKTQEYPYDYSPQMMSIPQQESTYQRTVYARQRGNQGWDAQETRGGSTMSYQYFQPSPLQVSPLYYPADGSQHEISLAKPTTVGAKHNTCAKVVNTRSPPRLTKNNI